MLDRVLTACRSQANRGNTTLIAIVLVAILGVLVYIAVQPNREASRIAIKTALTYCHDRAGERDLLRLVSLGIADSRKVFVKDIRKTPLEGCPQGFRDAYMEHIEAWDHGSRDDIHRTYVEVMSIARDYGVEPP